MSQTEYDTGYKIVLTIHKEQEGGDNTRQKIWRVVPNRKKLVPGDVIPLVAKLILDLDSLDEAPAPVPDESLEEL